jgi:hypothetical protein
VVAGVGLEPSHQVEEVGGEIALELEAHADALLDRPDEITHPLLVGADAGGGRECGEERPLANLAPAERVGGGEGGRREVGGREDREIGGAVGRHNGADGGDGGDVGGGVGVDGERQRCRRRRQIVVLWRVEVRRSVRRRRSFSTRFSLSLCVCGR